MSGIAGVVDFGAAVAPDAIPRMLRALSHRGPDGTSAWRNGAAALGHCAFNTTPESLGERQPLANESGDVVLVMDGRVDNRDELRGALERRGAALRDASDAELVLKAYEAFGDDSADRIVGEFAFMVWDARSRRLFGARDAAGTRHFFYHASAARTAFASEIRGLLALGDIDQRLNVARFLEGLVCAYDRDDQVGTCFAGIERLPAGHAMQVTAEGVRTWRWWDPRRLPELRFSSMGECAEAFQEKLRVATRCRLRANGAVATALSGGLDSSSVTGVAAQELREAGREPPKPFTLVHSDRSQCPELRSAQVLGAAHGLDLCALGPEAMADTWRRRIECTRASDEPFSVNNGLTDYLVCEAARDKGCRILLDGMAGDLLFYWFEDSVVMRPYGLRALPSVAAAIRRHGEGRTLARLVATNAASALLPDFARRAYRHARRLRALPDDARLLRPELARAHFADRWVRRPAGRAATEQEHHATRFLSGLLSFGHEGCGQVAFAHGIEPRSPFSDRRMIEFAIGLPFAAKAANGWYKLLMRNAGASYLPDEVRWRTDITMHPGGQFRAEFIRQLARHAPEIWNRDFVERTMKEWVDPSRLRAVWDRYQRSGGMYDGLDLLVLVLSAQWLAARFGQGSSQGSST